MNHPELLTLIQSVHAIFTFLVYCCLLASRQRCQWGTEMVLRDRNVMDGLIWECPLRTCRKLRSIRAGSFFEDSNISLGQWLNIIYLWSVDVLNKQLSLMTGISLRTNATTLAKISQICSLKILHGNIKLEWRSTSQCLDISASTTVAEFPKARGCSVWWKEAVAALSHFVSQVARERP